jgi:HAD superfamily hydrolase (TIGR01509 family)
LAKAAILFDFDGVVADSEILSNQVFADVFTRAGFPMTAEEAVERYLGKRFADCVPLIEADYGAAVDPDLDRQWRDGVLARLETDLNAVPGVARFLDGAADRAKAVASSSDPEWLHAMLARFGLAHHFGDHVYSGAVHVKRGKPYPDLYLHAADAIGADPAHCLVIEDSPTGVEAGVSAGMRVVALLAGGHGTAAHGERLMAAGAHARADSYDEVAAHLAAFEEELSAR